MAEDIWTAHERRQTAMGKTKKRDISYNRQVRYFKEKMPDSLSYHQVTIEGASRNIMIINSDTLSEKYIHSIPGESFVPGTLVNWQSNYWLITEVDVNSELVTRGIMLQCNLNLKWVDSTGTIYSQWCVLEDGTKYMKGNYEDRDFVTTRGDSRIALTIGRNANTVKFGRESRFLIDDPNSPGEMLSYGLTKPLKVGHVYNNSGVFIFVLSENNSTKYDNHTLGIADYYKYYSSTGELLPEPVDDKTIDPESTILPDGRNGWL